MFASKGFNVRTRRAAIVLAVLALSAIVCPAQAALSENYICALDRSVLDIKRLSSQPLLDGLLPAERMLRGVLEEGQSERIANEIISARAGLVAEAARAVKSSSQRLEHRDGGRDPALARIQDLTMTLCIIEFVKYDVAQNFEGSIELNRPTLDGVMRIARYILRRELGRWHGADTRDFRAGGCQDFQTRIHPGQLPPRPARTRTRPNNGKK